jgi:hypothetical protein
MSEFAQMFFELCSFEFLKSSWQTGCVPGSSIGKQWFAIALLLQTNLLFLKFFDSGETYFWFTEIYQV